MKNQVIEELWLEVASELASRLGKDRYERWLAPLRVLAATAEEVLLGVPNRFWLEWLEKSYLADVQLVLQRRLDRPVRVRMAIDPWLFQKMRRDQKAILDGVGAEKPAPEAQGPLEPVPTLEEGPAPQEAAEPAALVGGLRYETPTLDSFVVGASNGLAHSAALQVVESPGAIYNPFFIQGGYGLGKSHLLKGICHGLRRRHPNLSVRYITGEDFLSGFVGSLKEGSIGRFRERQRSTQVLALDDAHVFVNKLRTQEEFLHTFNSLVDSGRQVVIASDCHPRTMDNVLRPLLSRYLSGLIATVSRPDVETRCAILRRRQARSRVPLGEEVLRVAAEMVRGNVRELLGAYNLLEAHAVQKRKPLEAEEARSILARSQAFRELRPTLEKVAAEVARHFNLPEKDLNRGKGGRSASMARQIALYVARKYTDYSLTEIGRHFGYRNHSPVKAAEVRVGRLLEARPDLGIDLEKIIDLIQS